MRRPKKDIQLTSYDELLGLEETSEKSMNQVVEIELEKLYPFKNHPFHVNDDEKMAETVESIKNYGILNPALVRPRAEGGYELIAGHRRKRGCELAGKSKMPVLIRNYTDDEAVIVMVDSNIQRENLLPSEKAYAYKMKMDAMKKQGERRDLTSNPVGGKLKGIETAEIIGDEAGESANQVRRYIRLNELTDELLEFVDEGKIGMRPAVELSYLQEDEMRDLVDFIDDEEVFPSHAQTIRMKALSKEGKLDTDAIREIMLEEKPNQKARIKIPMEKIEKYFPSGTSQQQIEDTIVKALALYRQRQKENRDAR